MLFIINDLHILIHVLFDRCVFLANISLMSLLNIKNTKELALQIAETYQPDKTRISQDFLKQLENVVSCVVIEMVRSQPVAGKTLKDTDWGEKVVNNAKQVFTKLEPRDYLRGS